MSRTLEPGVAGTAAPRLGLWPVGAVAVGVAAVATTVIAAVARSLGAPLALDGNPIPLAAFPTFTVIGGVLGITLAVVLSRRSPRPRRTFVVSTVVLTALSVIPDLLVRVSPGSRVAMMLTHLTAAAIIVPTLSRRLPNE